MPARRSRAAESTITSRRPRPLCGLTTTNMAAGYGENMRWQAVSGGSRPQLPGLLPDYTPVIDDSGLALASPHADEF